MKTKQLSGVFWMLLGSLPVLVAAQARAGGLSAHDVTGALIHADAAKPVDYAGKDLSFLDLAGLNFKKAQLSGSNLYGADLSKSDLSNTNLTGARLDNANIAQADFSGANLKGASLLTVTAQTSANPDVADAPRFAGADLSDSQIAARLDGANFRNADLSRARIGQMIATWGSYRPRAVLIAADFSGARLRNADLSKGVFQFAQFRGADLTGANLQNCDFSKAVFTGADFSGADVTGADFDGADLSGSRGLDTATGLALAKNIGKAVR